MRLAEPGWLILLVLVPMPWIWERARPRLAWPTLAGFETTRGAGLVRLRWLPAALRGLAIGCMAVALARPQVVGGQTRIAGRGVAIVVALDNSPSMRAADFPVPEFEPAPGPVRLTRLEAAKQTFAKFVEGRPDDLIGLVVFANYPDLVCPPTLDHNFLVEAVRRVKPASPGDEGTNLGDAIAVGLDALRATSPKRKVLILLTDGRNAPAVERPLDPQEAADLARELGITLHTIAVGQPGGTIRRPEPTSGLDLVQQVDGPDLAALADLARRAGGRAFEAADAHALGQVFQAIDALEKTSVRATVRTRYAERFAPWAALALALLVADRLLVSRWLRRLP